MTDYDNHLSKVIKSYYPNVEEKQYLNKPYVELLPEYLLEGEVVEAVLFGKRQVIGGFVEGGLWSTNKRIVYLHTRFTGITFIDFSYDKIEGITCQSVAITIETAQYKRFIMFYPEKEASIKFISHVRSKMDRLNKEMNNENNRLNEQPGFIDQLEKLATLREKGLIDDGEFKIAKEKLLNS